MAEPVPQQGLAPAIPPPEGKPGRAEILLTEKPNQAAVIAEKLAALTEEAAGKVVSTIAIISIGLVQNPLGPIDAAREAVRQVWQKRRAKLKKQTANNKQDLLHLFLNI